MADELKHTVPEGWKLVPVEPTPEMLEAALRANMQHVIDCINDPAKSRELGSEATCKRTYQERYKAMLAASPTPPVAVARPADDQLWDQTLSERDHYHEVADKLASAIAEHFSIEIGEHSSANCPWDNALNAIEERTHSDAGALRKDAERWGAVHALMFIGNVELKQDEDGGYSISVDPVENQVPATWHGNTPEEAIDAAMKERP